MNILKELEQYGDVKTNKSFKDITTIKIGGAIKYLISPFSFEDLRRLMAYIKENKLKYKIIGKGSNLVCQDEPYDGIVITLDQLNNCYFENNRVTVESGQSAIRLANMALTNGLSGLEFIHGIPGSIGGLIFMNAGAYKMSISDVLEKVMVLKGDEVEWMDNAECEFSYRHSIFQEHADWIILAAIFKLEPKDPKEIKALMDERFERRKQTQPLDKPSCGSCFKNPEGQYVWQLIDGCNLRGHKINGIQISEKHPNFVVNIGGGQAKDFVAAIDLIKRSIKDKYGIDLKLEVELFGDAK
ncbi:MAG: UDP-N-acetylmuramate dehydrogenase [Erysipelotrichaceae bacterium]|nr:UDP-N-acetylmuramate dehydrogenase [Erysipelotrichaceae bacterium]